jgi:hypothetical protein
MGAQSERKGGNLYFSTPGLSAQFGFLRTPPKHDGESSMALPKEHQLGTDWSAIVVWTLLPVTVAAGFVYVALARQWEDNEWLGGLLALIPLEYFRAFVVSILSDTYETYKTPLQAVKFFLVSLLILLVIAVVIGVYVVGFHDSLEFIRKPEVYRSVAFAVAVIAIDGVISVYFFRGDAHRLAVRLQAVADDARDWLQLAAFQLPIVLALSYGVLLLFKETRASLAWVPDPASDVVRSACFLYAAFYFLGKAMLLAHANTASFNRTGRRLLGPGWIQFFVWEKNRDREKNARDECTAERKRLAVLMGKEAIISAEGSSTRG